MYSISNRMNGMKPSIIREILKQMSDPTLISFAGGNPSAQTFPISEVQQFSSELLKKEPSNILQYSVSEGLGSFRNAVKIFANRRQNETIVREDDEVLITSGSQQAINYTAKVLCNEGDIIAVESPAFLGSYNSFYSYGAKLAAVPMQKDGVDLTALERVFSSENKPKFFYCIPNFQNPTGYTTSLEKRKAIYALALKYGVPILEDDPYGELRFSGERIPSIKSLDEHGIVIFAGSFSKILCPGIRIAYCVCSKKISHHMVIAKQVDDVHTNVWAQRISECLITRTDVNKHIEKSQIIYAEKANAMAQALRNKCPEIKFEKPQGGMFIWANLPKNIDVEKFVKGCLDNKLAIVPGFAFYAHDENTQQAESMSTVRLNFSTPTIEQIEKGTDIMRKVLDDLS